MEKIDLYSTHLEYFKTIFNFKGKLNSIVEFGCGNYSTKFFTENSENTISIEMQSEEWYNKINNDFKNCDNLQLVKLIGPYDFLNFKFPEFIDLSFVDGHGSSRPECINLMMHLNCPIIVAHDTEEPGYQWYKVEDNNYKKITFNKYTNWTTIWSTDNNLLDYLKNKHEKWFT